MPPAQKNPLATAIKAVEGTLDTTPLPPPTTDPVFSGVVGPGEDVALNTTAIPDVTGGGMGTGDLSDDERPARRSAVGGMGTDDEDEG